METNKTSPLRINPTNNIQHRNTTSNLPLLSGFPLLSDPNATTGRPLATSIGCLCSNERAKNMSPPGEQHRDSNEDDDENTVVINNNNNLDTNTDIAVLSVKGLA